MRILIGERNWPEIQKAYDAGQSTRDLIINFNISYDTLRNASKLNLFVMRSRSAARKLAAINRPQKLSDKTKAKLSQIRKRFLKDNPDKIPYLLNHHSKGDSYPERYFEECLKGSSFVKKHRILNYQLDFADLNNLIDLEIDGQQHFSDTKIFEHDKKRNLILQELGWKIIRVRWSVFSQRSKEEKAKIIDAIISNRQIDDPSVLILESASNPDKIANYFQKQEKKKRESFCKCGEPKFVTSKRCQKCYSLSIRKFNRPSPLELAELVKNKSILSISKNLKISQGSFRKWCFQAGVAIPKWPKGYWVRRDMGLSHEESLLPRPKNAK